MTDVSRKVLYSSFFTKYIHIYCLIFPVNNLGVLELAGQKLSFQFYNWENWASESFNGLLKGRQVINSRHGICNTFFHLQDHLSFHDYKLYHFWQGFQVACSIYFLWAAQMKLLTAEFPLLPKGPHLYSFRPFHIFCDLTKNCGQVILNMDFWGRLGGLVFP